MKKTLWPRRYQLFYVLGYGIITRKSAKVIQLLSMQALMSDKAMFRSSLSSCRASFPLIFRTQSISPRTFEPDLPLHHCLRFPLHPRTGSTGTPFSPVTNRYADYAQTPCILPRLPSSARPSLEDSDDSDER